MANGHGAAQFVILLTRLRAAYHMFLLGVSCTEQERELKLSSNVYRYGLECTVHFPAPCDHGLVSEWREIS